MALGTEKTPKFSNQITGTWGVFKTPSGEIHYLETKAQLTTEAQLSDETKLTKHLVPVRELLDTKRLDFNQLLQRDLDDHRVATELVPYLLKKDSLGAAFFPPIVATFLPFQGQQPVQSFQKYEPVSQFEDEVISWRGYQFGESLRFEYAVDPETESDYPVRIGRVRWNPERARLVVLDGQHRAMAMLAINRTFNDTWAEGGEKYRFFYEEEIRRILAEQDGSSEIAPLEFPVTLAWFSDTSENFDHQKAARRLFVDVNKNAKAPSDSRILLLEDSSLTAIITRAVLNKFREDENRLPIYAVEYDHPGKEQARFAKWSVVSNIGIIEDGIKRMLFGPVKYIDDLNQKFGGRESPDDMGRFLRKTLALDEVIPADVEEDGFRRSELTVTNYPESFKGVIEERAVQSWAGLAVQFLSEIEPYKCHGETLKKLKDGWSTAEARSALARNAVFDGVGMFWTIRESHSYWQERNEIRGRAGALEKTDIVRAWDELEEKKLHFLSLRASRYGGSSTRSDIALVNDAYDILSTNAAQVGLFLTARTVAWYSNLEYLDVAQLGRAMVDAINAALTKGNGIGRRAIFSRKVKCPLVDIPKLDTPMAVYFRYYWLELLCCEEAIAYLDDLVEPAVIEGITADARDAYFQFRIQEQIKALRRTDSSDDEKTLATRARDIEFSKLKKCLVRWFGRTINEAEFSVERNSRGSREVDFDVDDWGEADTETPSEENYGSEDDYWDTLSNESGDQ